jgi:hypothetical protein
MAKLVSHLHFPSFHVYIGTIIRILRNLSVPLGLPFFFWKDDQWYAWVVLLNTQKSKGSKFKLKKIQAIVALAHPFKKTENAHPLCLLYKVLSTTQSSFSRIHFSVLNKVKCQKKPLVYSVDCKKIWERTLQSDF